MSIGLILISVALGVVSSLLFYTYLLYRHALFAPKNAAIVNPVVFLVLFLLAGVASRRVFAVLNISDASQQDLFIHIWVIVQVTGLVLTVVVDRRRNPGPHFDTLRGVPVRLTPTTAFAFVVMLVVTAVVMVVVRSMVMRILAGHPGLTISF